MASASKKSITMGELRYHPPLKMVAFSRAGDGIIHLKKWHNLPLQWPYAKPIHNFVI